MEEKKCVSCCEADVPKHQVHGYCARKGIICVNDAACEHYIRGEWKDRIRLRAQSEKSGDAIKQRKKERKKNGRK